MKILAVGDIVGESGVKKAVEVIPKLKEEEKIDFIVVNGENAAGGMGITEKNFKDILAAGADTVRKWRRCSYHGKSYMGKERDFFFYRSSKDSKASELYSRITRKRIWNLFL